MAALLLALVGIGSSVVGSFLPLNQGEPATRVVNLQAAGEAWLAFGVWLVLWFYGRVAAIGIAIGLLNGPRRQVGGGIVVALGSSLFLHPLASMVTGAIGPSDGPGLGAALLALGGLLLLLAGVSALQAPAAAVLEVTPPTSDPRLLGTLGVAGAIAYVVYEVVWVVLDGSATEDAVFQAEPLALALLSAAALVLLRRGSHLRGRAAGLLLGAGLGFTLRVPILLLPTVIESVLGYPGSPWDAVPAIPAAVAGGLLLAAGARSYREWEQILSRSTESVGSQPE